MSRLPSQLFPPKRSKYWLNDLHGVRNRALYYKGKEGNLWQNFKACSNVLILGLFLLWSYFCCFIFSLLTFILMFISVSSGISGFYYWLNSCASQFLVGLIIFTIFFFGREGQDIIPYLSQKLILTQRFYLQSLGYMMSISSVFSCVLFVGS